MPSCVLKIALFRKAKQTAATVKFIAIKSICGKKSVRLCDSPARKCFCGIRFWLSGISFTAFAKMLFLEKSGRSYKAARCIFP
jgi:hypothetical protein